MFNHHVWSPDGTMIAATVAFETVAMNADGSNIHTLTINPNADSEPDWSPDGTKIIFTSSRDNNQEIYMMNADGSGQINITNALDSSESSARWSPDGESILFRSDRNSLGDELYVMDARGGNIRKITNSSTDIADPQWQSLGSPSSSTPVPTAPGPTAPGPTAPPAANVDCDGDNDLADAFFMIAFIALLANNPLCPAPGAPIDDHIQGDADCNGVCNGVFNARDPLAGLRFILGRPLPGACG